MNYYHYTNVHAVQSIAQSRRLWLTDLRYMNDSSELLDGLKFLLDALRSPPESLFYLEAHLDGAVEYLSDSLRKFERDLSFEEGLFAMSLSSTDDLLSQWRAYGAYSMRFDVRWLKSAGLDLLPCIYSEKCKKQRARTAISEALRSVTEDLAVTDGGGIGIVSIDKFSDLIDLAATFKHEGFSEEKEVRMIVKPDGREVRYRSRGDLLIPYVEVEVPSEAISGVRVGPIRDAGLAFASMSGFASMLEMEHRASGGDVEYWIEVQRSSVPFRQ